MKLKKLVLVGYERFLLTMTRKVVYTPEKAEQIILGTNGSGKSSILYVLAHLVIPGSNFATGGHYEIFLEHRGKDYRLHSVYPNKAGLHTFEVNGENLNEGSTQAVQLELVEKHFGITKSIALVMTKKVRFTTMTEKQRRDWLMLLSGVNFEFVEKMYNEFRENVSDLKGYVRHLTESIDDTSEEIRSLEEGIEGTEETIERLRSELDVLLRCAGTDHDLTGSLNTMRAVGQQIKKDSRTLSENMAKLEPGNQSTSELAALLESMTESRMRLVERMRSHREQMEYFDRVSHDIGLHREPSEGDNDLSEASLKERIESLTRELTEVRVVTFLDDGKNAEAKMQSAISIRESLTDICSRLPVNDNGQFTRAGRAELQERDKALREDQLKLANRINQLEHVIRHAGSVDDVECPDCHGKFKPGIKPETVVRDKEELVQRGQQLDEITRQLKEVTGALDGYRDYASVLAEFRAVVGGAPMISAFWNKVTTDELQYKTPMRIPSQLERYIVEMDGHRKAHQTQNNIDLLKLRLEAVQSAGGTEHIRERIAELEEQFLEMTKSQKQLDVAIANIREQLHRMEEIDGIGDRIKGQMVKYQQAADQVALSALNQEIEAMITKHHERIGVLTERFSRYTASCLAYESKYEDKRKAQEQFESHKLIVKALSPNEGVIAEAIKRFTSHFTAMFNHHISQVWTYPMEVLAVVEDGVSLKCKFPLRIAGHPTPVPDVADGSEGQAEFIDFAFYLIVMELCGLHGYPLLIDEFGKAFDTEHRERVIRYIKGLMDDRKYSQMFMVSHYAQIYDTFTQAEYVVTDTRNIAVPESYNTNFVME